MGKFSRLGHELYSGQKSYDFIGKRALWYAVSGSIVLACLLVLLLKGLNFGVEFTGGVQYKLTGLTSEQSSQTTVDDMRDALAASGVDAASDASVSTAGDDGITIEVEELTPTENAELVGVIQSVVPVETGEISASEIGASWGQEVAQRAIVGVIVFVVIAMLFIALYFREWKMSVAAFVALVHDVVLTVGVYSLSGFSVTPAAVTGLLAILGFSLYDTVVVFDKVRENTHNLSKSRMTYGQAANLAVNQTLVRSINTSIVALIPIGAILYVSAVQLGASSLKDLALAQFVGMAAGVFSSVWIAPRILVHLKSGEKDIVDSDRRAKARAKRADPYAFVPSFADGMEVGIEPSTTPGELPDTVTGDPDPKGSAMPTLLGRSESSSAPKGPVGASGSSGRQQPNRKPRSKRK
ncbi:MAG: protein translocase subunit SecF [Nocardioides sp.]